MRLALVFLSFASVSFAADNWEKAPTVLTYLRNDVAIQYRPDLDDSTRFLLEVWEQGGQNASLVVNKIPQIPESLKKLKDLSVGVVAVGDRLYLVSNVEILPVEEFKAVHLKKVVITTRPLSTLGMAAGTASVLITPKIGDPYVYWYGADGFIRDTERFVVPSEYAGGTVRDAGVGDDSFWIDMEHNTNVKRWILAPSAQTKRATQETANSEQKFNPYEPHVVTTSLKSGVVVKPLGSKPVIGIPIKRPTKRETSLHPYENAKSLCSPAVLKDIATMYAKKRSVLLVESEGASGRGYRRQMQWMMDSTHPALGELRPKKIASPSPSDIMLGSSNIGKTEDNIERHVIRPWTDRDHPQMIWLEDLALFVGEGRYQGNTNDVLAKMLPYLKDGKLALVATVSQDDLKLLPANFIQQFERIDLPDWNAEDPQLPAALGKELFETKGVIATPDAIAKVLQYTAQYEPSGKEPERTFGRLERLADRLENTKLLGVEEVEKLLPASFQLARYETDLKERLFLHDHLGELLEARHVGATRLKKLAVAHLQAELFTPSLSSHPLGRAFLMAESGVGASNFIHAVSQAIHQRPQTVINMSEFAAAESVGAFTAKLGAALIALPTAVIEFHKPEAAHENVNRRLAELLAKPAFFTHQGGQKTRVYTHRSWWFITSSYLGSMLQQQERETDPEALYELVRESPRAVGEERRIPAELFDVVEMWTLTGPKDDAELAQVIALLYEQRLAEFSQALRVPAAYTWDQKWLNQWVKNNSGYVAGRSVKKPLRRALKILNKTVSNHMATESIDPDRIVRRQDMAFPCALTLEAFQRAAAQLE